MFGIIIERLLDRRDLIASVDISADHPVGDLLHAGLPGRNFFHKDAVAHDCDCIADRQDFLQTVCDENNGDTPRGHAADRIQQGIRLTLCQNSRGLVEDQKTQLVFGQFSCDFRELLVSDRHAADDHVAVDVDTHLLDGFDSRLIHCLPVECVQALSENLREKILLFRFAVEDDVLLCLETGDQGKFLMYHADSRCDRVKGG